MASVLIHEDSLPLDGVTSAAAEPPMYLQRPSSARSQDVSHILAKTFRQLFTRDTVDTATVKNLDQSKGSLDEYHEKYVLALNRAQEERNQTLAETAMLERHIMQAQARAMSADERALSRMSAGSDNFPDLGLPPVRAHFHSCIDTALLRSHNLITPEDFTPDEPPNVPPPQAPLVPEYARETRSSCKRREIREEAGTQSPWHPEEILDHPELDQPAQPEQDVEVMSYVSEDEFHNEQCLPMLSTEPSTLEASDSNLWRHQVDPEQRESDRKNLANLQAKVDYLKNPRYISPSAEGGRTLLKPKKKLAKQVGIKPHLEKVEKKEPTVIFLPSPPVITFTQYSISKVYEMTVELKNVTTVLRPVRVIPPSTTYFSISLGQFPGDKGLVAPGMSCHYTIRFSPDCLADFDDHIVVETQSSQPLIIPLQGRRTPPSLTLPSELSVGQCLVGGFKATQVLVQNEAGPGMFCIMNRDLWPATNFKTAISPGGVVIPPFQVRPGRFELGPGQSTVIDILFRPLEVKEYKQTITIVCDNCQVKHMDIIGEGQTASVEILSMEGGMSEAIPGEQTDVLANCLVHYDTLNPYTYIQKSLIVKNKVNVDLPFEWKISKPILKPPAIEAPPEKKLEEKIDLTEKVKEELPEGDNEMQEENTDNDAKSKGEEPSDNASKTKEKEVKISDKEDHAIANEQNKLEDHMSKQSIEDDIEDAVVMCGSKDRVEDGQSAFSVSPKEAVLPAGGNMEFVITFAPPKVADYHNVLELILKDIPIVPLPAPVIPVAVVQPSQRYKPPQSGTLGSLSGPNSESRPGLDSRPGTVPSGSPQPSRPPSTMSVAKSAGPEQLKTTTEVLSLSVETKGSCQAFSVLLQPYAIHLPGKQHVETAVKKQFRMINASVSSIFFEWEKVSADYILEVHPPVGEVPAQTEWELELTVSSSRPVVIDNTLICRVQRLDKPLMLHVQAEIKGPEVLIENPDMNLGLIQLGDIGKGTLTLRNMSQVTAQWNLRDLKSQPDDDGPASEFTFLPSSGELRPLEVFEVQVMYVPYRACSRRSVFQLDVIDGNSSSIAFTAEVQQPDVCLLACELSMVDIYLDVPSSHTVSLYNKTLLPTTFEWGKLEGSQASQCSVSIEPMSGEIDKRETKDFTLHFTPHMQGVINDVQLPCYITDVAKPVYLSLNVDVLGLSIHYTVSGEDDDNLQLDFGSDLSIGQQVTRTLVMHNTSGIASPYHISCDYFSTKPPTPPQRPQLGSGMKSQRRPIQSRSSSQMTSAGKRPKDLSQTFLRDDRGAAFLITPVSGILQPFCSENIQITAFSDMWGHYTDHLICKAQGLNTVCIPLTMSVRGCPLVFQMVAAQPQREPILRFGGHVSGIEPITRQMRINNTGPIDIRVDWQMFNLPLAADIQTVDDKRPLDFIVSYANSFPVKDENGIEVIPPYEDDSPCSTDRAPTDMIVDSPCTSDLTSRQMTITSGENDDKQANTLEFRPKIISVTLRSHIGEPKELPFCIEPSQLVIPGRGNNVITALFHPTAGVESREGLDCVGLAMGYMSLENEARHITDKTYREHGYQVPAIRLNLTAHIKPALLTVECEDDEGLLYRAAASDLIQNGQLLPEWHKLSSITMSNNTESDLRFDVISSDPFYLVQVDQFTRQPCVQLLQTGMTTLKPRQNIMIHVSFRVDADLFSLTNTDDHTEDDNKCDGLSVRIEELNNARKMTIKHQLRIQFNNGTSQYVPLEALLLLPSMQLSRDTVDFGTCLVGQTRQAEITLHNPSGSVCYWNVMQDYLSECCNDTTFTLTPYEGVLEANTTHLSRSNVIITVTFTAKHTEDYEGVFTIHHMLGEFPQSLTIKGKGSYDGKHEALVNV